MAGVVQDDVLQAMGRLFGAGTLTGLDDSQLVERFTTQRDEAAFAALVARHGPRVLSLCRSVLRDEHAAEDALQATFLVLARQAQRLRVGPSLGGWLRRVGLRVACEAGRRASRRRCVERDGIDLGQIPDAASPGPDERLVSLLEELGRLPEKYRLPIELCDLEGLTREGAARRLGWPPGTVAGRLARARERLRDRLARRGFTTGVTTESIGKIGRADADRSPLFHATVAACLGRKPLPDSAVALAEGVLRSMVHAQWIRLAGAATAALTLACGAVVLARGFTAEPDEPPRVAALLEDPKPPPPPQAGGHGAVVDPEGKPVEGVRVLYSERGYGPGWGHIVAEGKTEADGGFRLALPLPEAHIPRYGVLWAYRPGSLVVSRTITSNWPSELPARFVIGPGAQAAFEVLDPDLRPVAGARIEPRVLARDFQSIPDGLTTWIGEQTVTDAAGRTVMTALFPEEITTVFVVAKGYGRQQVLFGHHNITTGTKTVILSPVGHLKGRLTGPPEVIRQRPLTVYTLDRSSGQSRISSLESVTTDDEGCFEVDELVAGMLDINSELDITARWYVEDPRDAVIEAGRTTELEIPVREAVPIHGVVRERGTGRPIAGVGVVLLGGSTVRTGDDGRYAGFAPRGQVYVRVVEVPDTHASNLFGEPEVTIAEDVAEFEVPPIELSPAGVLDGIALDEQGRPVPGAEIAASWEVNEGPNRHGEREVVAWSGLDGTFRVNGVEKGAVVELFAFRGALRTPEPVFAQQGDIVPLVLDDSRAVAMSGRVADETGRPVPHARVHVREARPNVRGRIGQGALVEFSVGPILVTDAEGHYTTPVELDRQGKYTAFAEAPGFESTSTPWTTGASGRFPDVVLTPHRPAVP